MAKIAKLPTIQNATAADDRAACEPFPSSPPPRGHPAPVSPESGDSPFVAWAREEMARRGWRQADFARAAGVDVSMVSRWLHGRRPDPVSLERVATALGVDLDLLLTLAGHRPPAPRDDDPRMATLVAKVRQIDWTPERFLILDALLDDLRHRSPRVPIEQARLPGLDEGGGW